MNGPSAPLALDSRLFCQRNTWMQTNARAHNGCRRFKMAAQKCFYDPFLFCLEHEIKELFYEILRVKYELYEHGQIIRNYCDE